MCFYKVIGENFYNIFLLVSFLTPDKGKKSIQKYKHFIEKEKKNRLGQWASDLDMVAGNYLNIPNFEQR